MIEAIDSGAEVSNRVVIAEDEPHMRALVADILSDSRYGFNIDLMASAAEALHCIENYPVAVAVTDLKMPGIDGVDLLKFAKEREPLIQVVIVTGYATVESAIETLKRGAFDYIKKPFDNTELLHTVERAYEHYCLSAENLSLSERYRVCTQNSKLVGQSDSIKHVRKMIAASAAYDCNVLIGGPSGSGKEVVARQIHAQSRRAERRFVALNCAAIPENLVESELFGYKKGAFTGADRNKPGLLEIADGGTLFLDEINNASLSFQAKLLRVLQDGVFYSMGDTESKSSDFRVIAASNRVLPELIEEQTFREDLFYRLAVVEIDVPPLAERREDIPLLAYHFLNKFSIQLNKPIKGFSTEVLGALVRYDWPGSIRELESMVQRMLILCESDRIDGEVLPPRLKSRSKKAKALDYIPPQSLEELEAFFIRKTLKETKGDRSLSAEILGIDKSTLWRKMKRYRIEFDKE